jgi:hypothetical protein
MKGTKKGVKAVLNFCHRSVDNESSLLYISLLELESVQIWQATSCSMENEPFPL